MRAWSKLKSAAHGFRNCLPRLLFGFVVATVGCAAQAAPAVLPGFKMPKPPTIDGIINSDEWNGVPRATANLDTVTGEAAPEGTEFWLGYDSKYVYFAARLADRQPGSIHATQYQANVSLAGDDNIQLAIDLNGALATFSNFSINPRGATSISLAGGRALKREWAGDFLASGRITANGWEVEARIAWKLLAPASAVTRDIRFNVTRNIARTQRAYAYGFTGNGLVADVPIWHGIEVPPTAIERVLQLLPFGYAGYDNDVRGKAVLNSGLDAKMPLTKAITLVGSINPDFRNVENQILSIDFSHFERLAGETRPFFLEGQQYMNTALFASQRIPTFDAGVNTYGHISDKVSFGLIDTIRFEKENDFAANYTYDPNPKDSYRLTLTNLSQNGLTNSGYLARYSRQLGPYNVFLRSMGTKDTVTGSGQNENAAVSYIHDAWIAGLEYQWVSPSFNSRLGFSPELNYKGPDGQITYDKPWIHGPIAEAVVSASSADYSRIDGSPYRKNYDLTSTLSLRNGLNMTVDHFREHFETEEDHTDTVGIAFPRDNLFRNVNLSYQWGEIAFLPYENLTSSAAYRFNQWLQTNLSYQVVDHGGRQDQLIFTVNYDLRSNRALIGRLVEQAGHVNGFASFSRSGNNGVEYYLIVGDPNAVTFRPSVILKVVVPLSIRLA